MVVTRSSLQVDTTYIMLLYLRTTQAFCLYFSFRLFPYFFGALSRCVGILSKLLVFTFTFSFPHLVRADLFSLYVARALMHAALKVKMAKPTFVLGL